MSTQAMRISQASLKIHLQPDSTLDLPAFTGIFHNWIREKKIADQLLIDVADYQHVPDGPGIMLIANEAHYGMDSTGGEPGLRYLRRRDAIGDAKESLRDALRRAAQAALWLQEEELFAGKLRFRTDTLHMRVLSRLTAPNTAETREALEPIWAEILGEVGFQGLRFAPEEDARSPFGLRMLSCTAAPDLAALHGAL